MIWVDIAILILLTIYSIGGIARGFKQEAFSVIYLIVGFVVALIFCQDFAVLLEKVSHVLSTRLAVSFILLTSLTLGAGQFINWLLGTSGRKPRLSFFSRMGGVIIGFIHGVVIVAILVMASGFTPLPKDGWWQQSSYLPPFQSFSLLVKRLVSTKLASLINYHYPNSDAG